MVSAGDPPPDATAARDAAPAVAFRFEPRPTGRRRGALARWLLQGLRPRIHVG
jgi:hypothetical protein